MTLRFTRFPVAMRRMAVILGVGATTALAGCGSSYHPPKSFPPYNYKYLGQIHLNVGGIQVLNNATTRIVAGNLSDSAPIPMDQALLQMARDRLVATGQNGLGIFTIDQSTIQHEPGGTLVGTLQSHLDIVSSAGQRLGMVEARVTRTYKPDLKKGDADGAENLYLMTKQMMADMNVELEYQIRQHLGNWLVDAGGTPTADAIQTQTLGTPSEQAKAAAVAQKAQSQTVQSQTSVPASATTTVAPAATATSNAPTSLLPTEPDAVFPSGDPTQGSSTTARVKSPPAGYLSLPAGSKSSQGQ